MKSGISVVIITYNGAHRISNVLESLMIQSRPAEEVVIMIDGSKDNTRQVVEKYQDKLPLKIVEGPNQGRSGARNTGVANSSYELIVYLDDDTRAFADCLKDHWEHHQMHPGSILVGHILEDPELFTTDIQQYRITLYERMGWTQSFKERVPMTKENFFLAAANLSVSRTTFDLLNGFDVLIRDTEDLDFGSRAMQKGIKIFYVEGVAGVFHDDLITCKSFITRQRQYTASNKFIYELRPDMYEEQLKKFRMKTPFHKKVIYYFISTNTIVKMIDSGVMRYLLPKKIRYPFYDYVINGLVKVFPERKLT